MGSLINALTTTKGRDDLKVSAPINEVKIQTIAHESVRKVRAITRRDAVKTAQRHRLISVAVSA